MDTDIAGRFVCSANPDHADGVIVRVIEELDSDGIGIYVTNAGNPVSWADGTIGLSADITEAALDETEGLCRCGELATWDGHAGRWEAENARKMLPYLTNCDPGDETQVVV
jgi:hypothetical protein